MNERAVPDTHTGAHDALAVGWALHTLDEDEATEFAAHLEECPVCRRTVDETTEMLGGLAEAVVPVDPPPLLRRRLLDAVEAEAAPAAVPAAASPDASVVPLASRRRANRWLAVAAVALVIAAVGGIVTAVQSTRAERETAAVAAAQAERDAPVIDILRDAGTPGTAHATLADPNGALVGLVVDDGHGQRVLTTGLAANPTDEIYVLWGLVDGTPQALGTFDVGGQGPGVSSVPSTPEAVPFAGFAVSLEPGRTAPASPTRVVASGQVGR
ncbi:hypothetical protein Acsp06_62050 [Actinomycetospora sp. NBRC 106375]|uniref:anti-sigma factor n=1 Tax=Actinomycetospora sp. NBRC 106375 TaxID=3032207 RepID=UPI0024A44EBF|nr:anti-sigma factor [Actinomycetospora sp. NBRC 106375]GLZ50020.1 hypothetical protein Acsp06_62050 [Actinomycetospora sp. NBRC 106375]